MLARLNNVKHLNIEKFKLLLMKVWDDIPMHVVRAACEAFPRRMKLVIQANGHRIEMH